MICFLALSLYVLFQITNMYILGTEIRFLLKNCFQILVKTLKMKPILFLNLVVCFWRHNKLLGDSNGFLSSNRRIGRGPSDYSPDNLILVHAFGAKHHELLRIAIFPTHSVKNLTLIRSWFWNWF